MGLNRRCVLTIIFLFLALSALLPSAFCQDEGSEGYTVNRVLFIPPDFFVGDEVEMRILLRLDGERTIRVPESYPKVNWMRYSHILVQEKSPLTYEVRVFFSPYFVGTRTMPPLSLDGITLDKIKIRTRSVQEEGQRDFAETEGQAYLPGTRLLLALGIGFLLVIPLTLITLLGRVRAAIADAMAKKRVRRPFKRFLKSLSALEEQAFKFNARSFYIMLMGEFKKYLTVRTKRDFLSMTSAESGAVFHELIPDDELARNLASALSNSDHAKFAGKEIPLDIRAADLQVLRSAGETIERTMGGVYAHL